MPYEFLVVPKPGYLHVRVSGRNTLESVRRYTADLLIACREHDGRRVLLEECLEGPSIGTLDIFTAASEGSPELAGIITHFAYVVMNPTNPPDAIAFAETVARNRGLNLRAFPSVAAAEAWLAEQVAEASHEPSGDR